MIGTLGSSEIEEVLHQQVMGRIACHADGKSYIVPVSYAYDGEYIYVNTREGLKVQMMRKNPEICFETEVMENMANWKSVVAWGRYEELITPVERQVALHSLLERILPFISSETTHLSPDWPFPPKDISEIKGIIFRVHLEHKTGRFEETCGH